MTSVTMKKPCAKCDKGIGTAMCYGCEQAFCTKHFIEHRQELSQQMDNIGQDHDILCRDLIQESNAHPLLACINQWEQESIIKIQIAAESARSDLQQLIDKAKTNLKAFASKMTDELQSSRESDDYTELDIKKWTDQLEEYRKMLTNPTTAKIDYGSDIQSAVRLIQLSELETSGSSHRETQLYEFNTCTFANSKSSLSERFTDIFGNIALLEDGITATYLGDPFCVSWVDGIARYSSGIHYIRFRMELINTDYYSFLGIINSSEKMTEDVWNSTSRHGWWDLDYYIVGGEEQMCDSYKTIRTGDEVTLTLDCENRRMQLDHHRTNRVVDMSINIRICPFPWKIIVGLLNKDDCVRILQ